MKYYCEEKEAVLNEFRTTENGLAQAEAERRIAENGRNKLKEAEKESLAKKFLNSLADPMIIMLIAAAAIQAVVTVLQTGGDFDLGDFADVLVILVVVIINTIMSLVQESKAEAAMDALMQMTAATSKVLRDGKVVVIKSEDIAVGDVVVFEAGDAVPADCRILEAHSLKAEEVALTGESVPVTKVIDVLYCRDSADVPLGDRKNMLYSGSTIVYGRGKAVVTAVGMDTEMGKIAEALNQAEKEQTPLQKKMAELSQFLTKLVIGICVLVFAMGLVESLVLSDMPFSWALLGNTALDTFIAAIALAVAAIPEGLPAVVTIILSIGVTAMSKRQALIRKLTAVETLGCTQIICSDKTGTLTQNKMTVVEEFTADKMLLARAMDLCSDANIRPGEDTASGEPTECALVNYAFKLGLPDYELEREEPRVGEAPFDSMRKMMSTVHAVNGKYIQYTKGACDVMLSRCTGYLMDGKVVPMTDELMAQIGRANKSFADKALRVLCGAYREYDELPASFEAEELEKDLIFIGLVGMIDPCRPEVYDAIKECRDAGIRPIMITGDHKDTAVAIASELGILTDPSQAITGAELSAMSDEEFADRVENIYVYARVQPEHKTRIVNAWRSKGKITAMTGDGVNDAPSIKSADIGIGMGITGTDVTKNVADMVLTDDNFATIVNAVEEGRRIYDNIRKAIQFLLGSNLAEVLAIFTATLLGFTILEAPHLLFINLVTDCFPALALGLEKAESDIMRRRPRDPSDGIFAGGLGFDVLYQGVLVTALTLAAFFIGERFETGHWAFMNIAQCEQGMTMAFLTMSMCEIFHSFNMRSQRGSVIKMSLRGSHNLPLFGAMVASLVLTTAVIEIPFLANAFGFTPIGFAEYATSLALAFSIIPIVEIIKTVQRAAAKRKASR